MKILEIAFTLSPGGAERFVVDLSNELAKNNDVTLLVLKDDTLEPEKRNFYKFDLSENVKYACLHLGSRNIIKTWWRTFNYIRSLKPDIVHYHAAPMPLHIFPAMMLLNGRTRFVQTIHSDVNYGYNNKLYKFLTSTLGKSRKVKFVALSETNHQDFLKMYPDVFCTCIVNGRAPMNKTINFEDVRKEVDLFKKSDNTKVFLHVARCNEVKNQKRLVLAFNSMVEKGADAILIIIGNGYESKLGEEIKNLAGSSIHIIGPRKNIADYQFSSNVFCLSSDFEGMPISLLEALLSGTPVVSTPVCGAVDAVINGQNGVLAKDFSNEAYLEALNDMYMNLEKYQDKTQAQIPYSPYTIKICAEKYLKLFEIN